MQYQYRKQFHISILLHVQYCRLWNIATYIVVTYGALSVQIKYQLYTYQYWNPQSHNGREIFIAVSDGTHMYNNAVVCLL